jgi:hypothetical protein
MAPILLKAAFTVSSSSRVYDSPSSFVPRARMATGLVSLQTTKSNAAAIATAVSSYLGYAMLAFLGCFLIAAGLFAFFMWGATTETRLEKGTAVILEGWAETSPLPFVLPYPFSNRLPQGAGGPPNIGAPA